MPTLTPKTSRPPTLAQQWAFKSSGAGGKARPVAVRRVGGVAANYVPPTVHYAKAHVWSTRGPDGREVLVRIDVAERASDQRELARVLGAREMGANVRDVGVRYSHTEEKAKS